MTILVNGFIRKEKDMEVNNNDSTGERFYQERKRYRSK